MVTEWKISPQVIYEMSFEHIRFFAEEHGLIQMKQDKARKLKELTNGENTTSIGNMSGGQLG